MTDGDSRKTRIDDLSSAYQNYHDKKRNSTGTALPKQPRCFEQIDMVLKDKTTTKPAYVISSCGDNRSIDNAGEESDTDETGNDDNTIETLMNLTSIPILGRGSDNNGASESKACAVLPSTQDENISDSCKED